MHWIYGLASCDIDSCQQGPKKKPIWRKGNIMKKVAIVTGASGGIGRAVAKRLAQDGFAVVVNYLNNAAEAEQVVAELKEIGGNAIAVQADVSSPADVERLFDQATRKLGSVDVVVL